MSRELSKREAVQRLNALTGEDPEVDHSAADAILLEYVPLDVRNAYVRLVERSRWWATG